MLSVFYFLFPSYSYEQGLSDPITFLSAFPKDVIRHEFISISSENFSLFTGLRPLLLNRDSYYNITFNNQIAVNNGHPNIDNNAEFYALKGVNHFTRF